MVSPLIQNLGSYVRHSWGLFACNKNTIKTFLGIILRFGQLTMILCSVGEVIIFEHGIYISALENIRIINIKQLCSSGMYKRNL